MQKRIVVLGGVGFIGSHLCLRLLNDGHEVFCVDIRDTADSPLLRDMPPHPEFRYVRHNIVNAFGIRCDEIYNLAAPSRVRYNKALPVESLKVSILGSINALDTARSEHARILYASTGDIYGTGYRDTSVEAADGCPTHRTLAEGKRAGEALHRAYQYEFGVDARIARIFNTYGSGADLMDQRVVMKMIVAALQNRDIPINGSGEQLALAEDSCAVVQFAPYQQRQAHQSHHVQFFAGVQNALQPGQRSLLEGALQKQVAAGVAREAELREDRQLDAPARSLAQLGDDLLGVIHAVRHPQGGGEGCGFQKTIFHRRISHPVCCV